MVGTAGFSADVEITKAFEPATDGYLQATTEGGCLLQSIALPDFPKVVETTLF